MEERCPGFKEDAMLRKIARRGTAEKFIVQ